MSKFYSLAFPRKRLLFAFLLAAAGLDPAGPVQAQPAAPALVGLAPARNAVAFRRPTALTATFSEPMDGATLTSATMGVFSAQRGGRLAGTYTGGGTAALFFQPGSALNAGETVFTTLTRGLRSSSGTALTRASVQQLTADAAPATAAFQGGYFRSMGGSSAGLCATDLNGDGILDAAVATRNGGIDFGFGTGTGDFTGIYSLGLGGSYTSITPVDVNGDGAMELLVPRVRTNSVYLLGYSATGVSSLVSLSVDADARQAAVADIDGDGDQDAVIACFSGRISIRFNDGQGVFSGSTSVALASAYGVACGDLDNDGDIDFVGTNYNGRQVASFLNNGNGVFSAGQVHTVGTEPIRVTLADVNADGYLDALTSNMGSNTVSVALNNGAGTFLAPVAVPANRPGDAAVGDVDGDGDLDFVVADYSYGVGISVRLNNGTGTFSAAASVWVADDGFGGENNNPFGVVLADLDRNGTLDILTSTYGGILCSRLNPVAPALLTTSTTSFCSTTNAGTLTLSRAYGALQKYEFNTGTGYQDVPGVNTGATLAFSNLATTTTFRAVLLTPEGRTVYSAPLTINIYTPPVASVSAGGPTTFCQGGNVRLTASGGATYRWSTGATTASILVTASGSYSVTATSTVGCSTTSAPTTVTVNPLPSASVTYASTDLCTSDTTPQLPAISGTTGGTFSAGPGLHLDATTGEISGAGSQPGSYYVAYQYGSTCPRSTYAFITISAPPEADFQYPAATYCLCAPATPVPVFAAGARAGTFTAGTGLALNPATGAINVAGSLPGRYIVTNTVPGNDGCPAVAASTPVTIEATPPVLVINQAAAVPAGTYQSITVTGTGAATLSGPVVVHGSVEVQAGGAWNDSCHELSGPGSFTLAAGATLSTCSAQGLAATGSSGAVQVTGTRFFSPDASYVYSGTVAQQTGTGLPPQVRSLTTTNPAPLTLTQPVRVRQVLTLGGAGNLDLNGQALTLLSDAGGTALVVNAGSGVVTGGTATMQRHLSTSNPGPGYRHYSAPVAGSTVADLQTPGFTPRVNAAFNTAAAPAYVTPYPTVFGYDQARLATSGNNLTEFDKGWVSPASPADALQVGRGYTALVPGTETVDFTGTLNTGPYLVALQRNGGATAAEAGWHLVGNPYPAPLDYSLVDAADRQNLDEAIYVFESTRAYSGTYRSYVNGVGGGSPLIGSSQGFFVRVSPGQTGGSLRFRNTQRVTSYGTQAPVRRGAGHTRPLLQLNLQVNDQTDALYVYAEAGATAGTDAAFDAVKLPNPTAVNLSALAATGEALSIQGLPAWQPATVVPLMVQVPAAGACRFEVGQLVNLPAGTQVYLRDNLGGTSTLLYPGLRFAFTTSARSAVGRFSLEWRGSGPLASPASLLAQQVTVYPTPSRGQATLLRPVSGAGQARAVLLNSLGQQVRTFALPALQPETRLDLTGLATGVYSLRVPLADGQQATRRVVIE